MAQIDLGKLKFQWKGLWATSTAYEVDDVVHFDGSTYVVKTAVPNTNTTNPGLNNSFELMARGLKFRGVYSNTATYLHNEVVTFNGASWISIQSISFTNQTPQTGSAYWEVLTPAPASNVLTTPGDLVYVAKDGVTARLPVGSKGSTLQAVESPNQTFARGFTYSVGSGATATAIATDLDSALVVGTNTVNAQITLTRGRNYSITFPANGKTYSVKDPAAVGYTTLGTGGRLTAGVSPTSVTNGGTLLFSPSAATPNTVKIRDELGGTDEITVTVVNMAVVPSWTGTPSQRASFRSFSGFYNTMTVGILPNSHVGGATYGRGFYSPCAWVNGYRKGAYISTNGKYYQWGNQYNNGTQGVYYNSGASGFSEDITRKEAFQAQLRLPRYFMAAVAGDPNEAQWLTDLNGNALGYTSDSVPKIIEHVSTGYTGMFLLENGILLSSGYGGFGLQGNGSSSTTYYAAVPVQFYNASSTALTGVNRPKIKFIAASAASDQDSSTSAYYAIDTNGFVYRMGHNNYGQLGDGTTTNNYFFRQLAASAFNNEKIVYLTTGGGASYASVYAITESGKLWSWGYNLYGQLGLNDTTNRSAPVEATAVAASGINGKKITHVLSTGGGASTTRTWVLTTEGKVYAAGHGGDNFGNLLGVYSSTAANAVVFTELTNSSTTINSGSQKVVSIWATGGRYSTQFAITDGGTANQPKVYSWGYNGYGQLCRNESITNTASATVQGNWLLGEVQFRDFGDQELNPGTNDSRPNEVIGTQYSAVWNNKRKFGTIVAIWGNGSGSATSQAVVMLDSLGNLYSGGYWATYTINPYQEMDNIADWSAGLDYSNYLVPCWSLPEPMVDFCFLTWGEEAWSAAGASGTVYTGGINSWLCTGELASSVSGFHPVVRST
jgi:hypothetical protein